MRINEKIIPNMITYYMIGNLRVKLSENIKLNVKYYGLENYTYSYDAFCGY